MVRAFAITGRKAGQVFMPDMAAALSLGDCTEVALDTVITEPGWTLFSYDFASSEAVFLDIGETDLSRAPFSYQRQYECARRLIRLPLDEVVELSAGLPASGRQAHLLNIGHCGSTLLHNVFNRTTDIWCLSEPLFVFDVAMARATLARHRRQELLRAGFAFMRLLPGYGGQVQAMKHFSQALTIAQECHQAAPDATFLFLYRDAEAWCNSVCGFVQRMGGQLVVPLEDRGFVWGILSGNTPLAEAAGLCDLAAEVLTLDQIALAVWVLQRRLFQSALAAAVPMQATRYDKLLADRPAALARIFAQCGCEGIDMAAALSAFDTDSHQGTATARSVPVTELDKAARARVVAGLTSLSPPLTGWEQW